MSDHSKIEWTDATWNPVTGCSVLSPGCTNCYAMKLAGTRLRNHASRAGLTNDSKAGPIWNGQVRFNEGWLSQPLKWKQPRMVFVCAHGDLFHEDVPDAWIDRVFAVMALAPQHTFQVLTKRAKRMRKYLSTQHDEPPQTTAKRFAKAWPAGLPVPENGITVPLPNVWLGVSAERQQEADARIPELLATPAAVRFLSLEPLLGPIDLDAVKFTLMPGHFGSALRWHHQPHADRSVTYPKVDWVIVGGESGDRARPMHPNWVRAIREQCWSAGTPFFFKQWGAWKPLSEDEDWGRDWFLVDSDGIDDLPDGRAPAYEHGDYAAKRIGKAKAGRLLDGVEHGGMPARAGQ